MTSTSRLSSWGTTPISARATFDSAGSSWPRTRRTPESGSAWPVSSRIVVDLPAPLGPSRPRQMPSGTSRSRPSTAVIGPNLLTTPRSSIAAIDLMLSGHVRRACGSRPWKTGRRARRAMDQGPARGDDAGGGTPRGARAPRPLSGLDDRRPARRRLRRRPHLRRAGRARRPRARDAERARRRDDRPRRRLLPGRGRRRGGRGGAGRADPVRGRHQVHADGRGDDRRAARPRGPARRPRRADPRRRGLLRDQARRPLRARSGPARSPASTRPTGR